ncbi:MAG TPA: integrase [Candidatus Rokubacteria bacterium]|nr:integrase [Candidatus Rokubacteria bacterium]
METMTAELVPAGDSALAQAQAGPVLPAPPPIDRCPVAAYLLTLTTDASRRSMTGALRRAAGVISGGRCSDPCRLNWPAVRRPVVEALRDVLQQQGVNPATIRHTQAAVRGVLGAAFDLGLLDPAELLRIQRVRPARGERVDRAGRCLTRSEVAKVMGAAQADPNPSGTRDRAVLAVLLGCGLRRSELVELDLLDLVVPDRGPATIYVRGKGNKERAVYLTNGALRHVADWLELRGDRPGPLFLGLTMNGKVTQAEDCRPLTGSAVDAMVKRRAEQAGIRPFSPHDCRRTYISGLLDQGVDIATAADLAGHAQIETTRIYDRRGARAAKEAARTVKVPYFEPPAQDEDPTQDQ